MVNLRQQNIKITAPLQPMHSSIFPENSVYHFIATCTIFYIYRYTQCSFIVFFWLQKLITSMIIHDVHPFRGLFRCQLPPAGHDTCGFHSWSWYRSREAGLLDLCHWAYALVRVGSGFSPFSTCMMLSQDYETLKGESYTI